MPDGELCRSVLGRRVILALPSPQHATGVFLPFGIVCSSQRIEDGEQATIVEAEAGSVAALVGLELRLADGFRDLAEITAILEQQTD
jgi:hypothetical protein